MELLKIEDLSSKLALAQGTAVSFLGKNCKDEYARYFPNFRCKDKWTDDTGYAIISAGKDFALHVQRATDRKIGYSVVGTTVFSPYGVLWRGRKPFLGSAIRPDFVCFRKEKEEKKWLAELSALLISEAEEQTRRLLDGQEEYDLSVFKKALSGKGWQTEQDLLSLPLCARTADGFMQTQAALSLLLSKEEKEWNDTDRAVLVADFLANVYNSYVRLSPTFLFPPDNGARREGISEFFGCSPPMRKVKSEYEIRLFAYRLQRVKNKVQKLWEEVCTLTANIKNRYSFFAKDGGFCLGSGWGEDIRFAMFLSPDILDGESLLSAIKDSGGADAFL